MCNEFGSRQLEHQNRPFSLVKGLTRNTAVVVTVVAVGGFAFFGGNDFDEGGRTTIVSVVTFSDGYNQNEGEISDVGDDILWIHSIMTVMAVWSIWLWLSHV